MKHYVLERNTSNGILINCKIFETQMKYFSHAKMVDDYLFFC